MRVGITGHRGLSAELESRIWPELERLAAALAGGELTGVTCLADGPDTWWAETVLDQGGRLEVVVPAARYRAGLPDWHHRRYDELLKQASEVHGTGLQESSSEAHQAGSEILVGLVDELVAVWDGLPARGYGGTADVVAYARRVAVPVRIVWPEGAARG